LLHAELFFDNLLPLTRIANILSAPSTTFLEDQLGDIPSRVLLANGCSTPAENRAVCDEIGEIRQVEEVREVGEIREFAIVSL
jgi:hypothetical protein